MTIEILKLSNEKINQISELAIKHSFDFIIYYYFAGDSSFISLSYYSDLSDSTGDSRSYYINSQEDVECLDELIDYIKNKYEI